MGITKSRISLTDLLTSALLALSLAAPGMARGGESKALDTIRIEQLIGAKGQINEKEQVFKVSVPRADLKVSVAGVKMTPALGLTSWAAFTKAGDQTMVIGDMTLLEDQVNPVMDVALANGLEITALHNHFFWDSPKVMFMHIGGMGPEEKLAVAVGRAFAKVTEAGGRKGQVPRADLDPFKTWLDPRKDILGVKGGMVNGVYKIVIRRTTQARVVFLHYWGVGTTTDLAKGLKAALATQKDKASLPHIVAPDLGSHAVLVWSHRVLRADAGVGIRECDPQGVGGLATSGIPATEPAPGHPPGRWHCGVSS